MLSNDGKIRDRNPEITAAGKKFGSGDSAHDCMKTHPERLKTPDQVKKFRCTTQPAVGKTRIFYGRYNDQDSASQLSHGVNTKPSYVAGQLINPSPKSYFQFRQNDKREEGVYTSRHRAPLGKSHDQRKGLPKGIEPYGTRFGVRVVKDISAGELVNPYKSNKELSEEATKGLELYKKSHSAYGVGESYNRKYDWSRIPSTSSFGVETPHDNRGLNTKKTLKWLHETMSEKASHISSKRVDDFRERQIPQVGQVHDPIKETLDVDKYHVFGIMVEPDKYCAGDLIHMRNAGSILQGKERERGVLAAIRQHLKKANYQNFSDLKAAFMFYDKDKSGSIDIKELREICHHFHLPVQDELMEILLESIDEDNNGIIDYIEFVNFLNWKLAMPSGFQKHHVVEIKKNGKECTEGHNSEDIATSNIDELKKYEKKLLKGVKSSDLLVDESGNIDTKGISNQMNPLPSNYTTTSASMYHSSGLNEFIKGSRNYGIPTIRSDLPAPKIRRIGDNTNYGDESDAYGLINPSIYSNHGVYEEDFFKGRSQNDIRRICDSIGVEMTNEVFQDIWKKASKSMKNGQVSVESFRNVLDEQIAEEYQKMIAHEEESVNHLGNLIRKMTTAEKAHVYKSLSPRNRKKEMIAV